MTNLNFDKVFPLSCPVIFFHAHPDDESFLSAGIISQLHSLGRECNVIFAASALVEREEKTIKRQKEAFNVCRLLGVSSVLYLDFCEPKFSDDRTKPLVLQEINIVSNNLFYILKKNKIKKPFVFVSYDKNGGYGNKDHKIVHLAGKLFCKKHKNLVTNFLSVVINRDKTVNWLSDASKRLPAKSLPKLSYWDKNFGLTNNEITYKYCLTIDQLKTKRKALTAHKSQISLNEFPLSLSEFDFKKVFGCEYLRDES